MATKIGTRSIPWLSDQDPKRQQFFEEVKHKLDNIDAPAPPQVGTITQAKALVGMGSAAVSINAFKVLTSNSAGELIYADASVPGHADQILGIALNSAAPNAQVTYTESGDVENMGWSWTPGEPLFLGIAGALTHNPNVGVFQAQVGYAKTPTLINFRVGISIHR